MLGPVLAASGVTAAYLLLPVIEHRPWLKIETGVVSIR